jgi:hypothetical protein
MEAESDTKECQFPGPGVLSALARVATHEAQRSRARVFDSKSLLKTARESLAETPTETWIVDV